MDAVLKCHREGHVWCMGLNRPDKRNAFDLALYEQLSLAFGELDRNPELRVGMVYAVGGHFTAGLDLPAWAPVFASGQSPALPSGGLDPCALDPARRVSKPVLYAIEGNCLTIGIELMLAADIRVAAETARFGQIEVQRGIYPVGGATIRLMQELGWGNAMRYLLTGDWISAGEALRMGLVQEVVPAGSAYDRTLTLAGHIAQQAPLGVQAALASARLAREAGEQAAIARLLPDLMPIMQSADVREGLAAFLERRTAHFTGQ